MSKYSAPEHHHFTVPFVPETIIFEISLRPSRLSPPTAGLLNRAPRARSRAPHFHARPRFGAPHFDLPRRSRVSGRPECQPGASYSQFRRPVFSRSSSPSSFRSPAFQFTLELGPEPPIFHFAAAHTYPNPGVKTIKNYSFRKF